MNSSSTNLLGFSLSSPPQYFSPLAKDGNPQPIQVEEEEEGVRRRSCSSTSPPHLVMSAMPLRSDGSLFTVLHDGFHTRPFSHQLQEWSCQNHENPKLEDFLGNNTNTNSQDQENNKMVINVNAPPQEFYQTSPYYNFDNHLGGGNATLTGSSSQLQNCYSTSPPFAISEFKSWLGQSSEQPALVGSIQAQAQALSLAVISPVEEAVVDGKKRGQAYKCMSTSNGNGGAGEVVIGHPRKCMDTFGQRTSQFRGVTRHRWTGRYEAHLWDNSCRNEGQTRKGRQVYLGGYDKEEKAARAYDLAALKYWGPTTHINFPISDYEKELEDMNKMNRQEFVAHLRRRSSGFSRGASMYRGVTRHHQHGRWQARIGRVAGNKDLYLGTFSTQEEAAEAYDIAAIKFRGTSAVTNFEITRYDVNRICSSSTLLGGDLAKRSPNKDDDSSPPSGTEDHHNLVDVNPSPQQPLAITNIESGSSDLANILWN